MSRMTGDKFNYMPKSILAEACSSGREHCPCVLRHRATLMRLANVRTYLARQLARKDRVRERDGARGQALRKHWTIEESAVSFQVQCTVIFGDFYVSR